MTEFIMELNDLFNKILNNRKVMAMIWIIIFKEKQCSVFLRKPVPQAQASSVDTVSTEGL